MKTLIEKTSDKLVNAFTKNKIIAAKKSQAYNCIDAIDAMMAGSLLKVAITNNASKRQLI